MITSYVTRLVQLRDFKLISYRDFKALADSPGVYLANALYGVERTRSNELQEGADPVARHLLEQSFREYEQALGVLEKLWTDEMGRSRSHSEPPGVF
jgi:hypothetical protein